MTHPIDAGVAGLFAPGQLLAGRYRVVRFLARGGMSEVYEADDVELSTRVAIKAMAPGGVDGQRETRLRRELQLARQVTHPNVCRVFDVAHEGLIPFVTMELLDGESLSDRLARTSAMAVADALPIVEQLVAGLEAAHEAGVVHRDFKPHNVMLVGDPAAPRVVITDFGLARALASEPGAVATIDFAGSPAYMAPEQVRDEPTTAATDVYGLGVTMFELVTGTLPFDGQSPLALAVRRIHQDAPRASTRARGLDPRWDAAIARCLADRPADRFVRVAHVVASLRGPAPTRSLCRTALGAAAVGAVAIAIATAVALRAARAPAPLDRAGWFRRSADGPIAMSLRLGADRWGVIQRAIRTPDGDLVLGGHLMSPATIGGLVVTPAKDAGKTAFVARLAPDGHARWVRLLGRDRDSTVTWIELAGDQLLVTGHHYGPLDLGGGVTLPATRDVTPDCWVAAMDAARGTGRWAVGCGASGFGHARRVIADAQGNAYVVGEVAGDPTFGGAAVHPSDPATGRRIWFVASFRRDGTLRWATTGDRAAEHASAKGLTLAGDAVVFAGSLWGATRFGGREVASLAGIDCVLGGLDAATGAVRWIRAYGGSGSCELGSVAALPDERLVGAATFTETWPLVEGHALSSAGIEDGAIVLFDADGTPRRAWHAGSAGHEGFIDLAVTTRGVVAVGRGASGTRLDDHPVAGMTDPARAGAASMPLLVKLDPDGGRVEAVATAPFEGALRSITVTPEGSLLVAGRFRRELEVGGHVLRAPDSDGLVIELRDLPPPGP